MLCQRVTELASGQIERRIATLFLRLADQIGVSRKNSETWIPMTLSRQDIADMCGTTVETAIRTMGRFKTEIKLRKSGKGFILGDRNALIDLENILP